MTGMLRNIRPGALATAGLLALAIASPASGEDGRPTETHGISLEASDTLPLGEQRPDLQGYALQIRTIVLQPGAVAGYHSHANRPVVAWLVRGDYTEHRDGQGVIVHQPGEQWVEGADVAHWSENRGTEPALLINVEVVPVR